jgi:hypothetical protein
MITSSEGPDQEDRSKENIGITFNIIWANIIVEKFHVTIPYAQMSIWMKNK